MILLPVLKRPFHLICILFLSISFYSCASTPQHVPPSASGSLKRDLTELLKEDVLRSSHIGIEVKSMDRNEVLFSYNAGQRFIPASNVKLFTVAAGLAYLTPDFVYETKLMQHGVVESGVLKGDLIIVGSGDPTISGYFHDGNPTKVFEDWAETLKQSGIRSITGNIVIDNSFFRATPLGPGWSWDDELFCYSASNDAFSFNNNCVAVVVAPGNSAGDPVTVRLEPGPGDLVIVNNAKTGDQGGTDDISIRKDPCTNTITISGGLPMNHPEYRVMVSVERPACYGGLIFKEILAQRGVSLHGRIDCGQQDEISREVRGTTAAIYRSLRLSEIVKVINKKSNNFTAEQLFLTIGKIQKGEGSQAASAMAIKEYMETTGMDTADLSIVDGSGLSRYNLVTPKDIVALLDYMAGSRYFGLFYDSLAIAGMDGTLKRRMQSPPLQGNLRGKTGSMNHVRNLSGYMTTGSGERLAFAILINNFSADPSLIEDIIERICLRLIKRSMVDSE